MSHLDYINSLLYGLSDCNIDKLQSFKNCAAKLVLNRFKYDSRTQAFIDLHWLPIQAHIDNKILICIMVVILFDLLLSKVSQLQNN